MMVSSRTVRDLFLFCINTRVLPQFVRVSVLCAEIELKAGAFASVDRLCMLFFTVGVRSGTSQSAVDLTDPQLQSMTTRSVRSYTHEQFGGGRVRDARRTRKHRGS